MYSGHFHTHTPSALHHPFPTPTELTFFPMNPSNSRVFCCCCLVGLCVWLRLLAWAWIRCYWGMVNLPVAMSLKKMIPLLQEAFTANSSSGRGSGPPDPPTFRDRQLKGPVLLRPCAAGHCCREFLSVKAVPYAVNSILQHPSLPILGPYCLSALSSTDFPELWWEWNWCPI